MFERKLAPDRAVSAADERVRTAPGRGGTSAWLCAAVVLGGGPLLGQAARADELAPFQASYVWLWHGAAIAQSKLALEHRQGDTWVYSSASEPRGIGRLYPMRPSLQSTMRITAQGVQPLSFTATGSGRSHDAEVKFDWNEARVTGTYEGTNIDLPLKSGIQDDLSVQIAMLVQLLHGKTPEQALEIDKNSVRAYDYVREGQEMLDTPLGKLDTIVYASRHPGSPRTTRFWCAPSQGYIPLQIEQKRDDDVEWTMKIQSLKRQ